MRTIRGRVRWLLWNSDGVDSFSLTLDDGSFCVVTTELNRTVLVSEHSRQGNNLCTDETFVSGRLVVRVAKSCATCGALSDAK